MRNPAACSRLSRAQRPAPQCTVAAPAGAAMSTPAQMQRLLAGPGSMAMSTGAAAAAVTAAGDDRSLRPPPLLLLLLPMAAACLVAPGWKGAGRSTAWCGRSIALPGCKVGKHTASALTPEPAGAGARPAGALLHRRRARHATSGGGGCRWRQATAMAALRRWGCYDGCRHL